MGVAPAHVGEHRRMAGCAAGVPGRFTCVTTVIWWRLGPAKEPYAWTAVQQVRFFLLVWRDALPARKRAAVAEAWPLLAAKVMAGQVTWAHSGALLLATQITLHGLGFDT